MGRPREYSGPLRPGELSANAVQNRLRIYARLRKWGDFKQCYCPFFPTRIDSCRCEPCPKCDRKGRNFRPFEGVRCCLLCYEKLQAGLHHTQPLLSEMG
jgi:hypothetical protein